MSLPPGRAKRLIAVRHRAAFPSVGAIELERDGGNLLFFRPALDDPAVASKGMRQVYLFARRWVRNNLRDAWQNAWMAFDGRVRPVPAEWDVDHVFPVCWAEARGFEYVLLTPVPRSANRSSGAGLEKTAARKANERLLARYVDTDVTGNFAYLTAASIAKLMGVAPGPASRRYPGLARIQPDLEVLQAALGY